jgi:hypothetical protein
MDWTMVGSIGEIVGAIGVIATLLYLARQVRSASIESQRARYGELTASVSQVAAAWSEDGELADIMLRGFRDPSVLEPCEVFRFYSSLYRSMKAWEASYHYSLEGGLHDWGSEGLLTTMTSFMAYPGMQQYWATRRDWFSREFQQEVDRGIAASSIRLDSAYSPSGIGADSGSTA